MFPPSYAQALEGFQSVFGRPPIYFDAECPNDDVPMEHLLAALFVDGHGALNVLGHNARETLQILAATGFKFDQLVCDQYRSGISLRQLQNLHRFGRRTLRDILQRNGMAIGQRRERTHVADEQLLEAYARSGMYTVVGREFGMHRTTVASRLIKNLKKL